MIRHVAIVGGGFSGSLHAINLLRHDGPSATLVERRMAVGTGVAYGSAHPSHLLNVRASNMSALPDQPDHFVRWLERRGERHAARTFAPRLLYGTYLSELLEEAVQGSAGRLKVVHGDAVALAPEPGGGILLADGRRVEADAVVLAPGNLPPHAPPGIDPDAAGDWYRPDPWAPDTTAGLGRGDTVLVIGTGLTMVDVALKLDAEGFGGRVVAVSRRGLLPRAHADAPAPAHPLGLRPTTTASQLTRAVRRRAGEIGWRPAVDELRPFTQAMWRSASGDEHARFLRHLRAWWDVHRHRIAPVVADRLAAMQAEGRLVVRAGRPFAFEPRPDGVAVRWRPRGADTPEVLHVSRVINCTGPQGDLLRSEDPLIRHLLDRGLVRPDRCRLGIDVSAQAEAIDAAGRPSDTLFALGPMTRGAFWEIVAVPDIREQAWTLARRLSHAQWVGGEGL